MTEDISPVDDSVEVDDVEEPADDRFIRTHIEGASGGARPGAGQQGSAGGAR